MAADLTLLGLPPPLSADEYLREMSTELPGVYLLGSLNRHITVHSQQLRAVNLIRALMKDEQGTGIYGKSIAIVGAGFAGLTAAALALERTSANISLFDAAPRPLWLQDGCANRWLHPGIYDWPLPGSLEPCTALPFLNWRAGAARDVAAQVRTQWDRIAATKQRLDLHFESRVGTIAPTGDNRYVIGLGDGRSYRHDIVVLAVGFGIEPGSNGRAGYWNDADGLDGLADGSAVLVCGFGDGGLADVLRLCLPEIPQHNLVEFVRHVPAEFCRQLVEWDATHAANSARLDALYAELKLPSIIERIGEPSPALPKVTLCGKGHLFAARSAILNRFLISQLRQARGPAAFELVIGETDERTIIEHPNGRRSIVMPNGNRREFDSIALRLGPVAAYRNVSPLSDWKVGEERRRHWYELPQSLDKTRIPLDGHRQMPDQHPAQLDFLAYESSSRRWCLVLHPKRRPVDWVVHLRIALEQVRKGLEAEHVDVGGLNVEPLLLCSDDAVQDRQAVARSVRALCAADIVIADITGYDPALLFLLGIRAAVRRSVTVACTKDELTPKLWAELPFNLKELNLVSMHHEGTGNKELAAALAAGLTQSGKSAGYLDLPVYDYVREESADDDAISRILMLRAFGKYDDEPARAVHVEQRIRDATMLHIEAVVDQKSPRLAGQRLYEAIRHWNKCVVDLTWWRANVMFELGVRLAVRAGETYCLIDASPEGAKTFEGSRSALRDLLAPFVYTLATTSFAKALAKPVHDEVYRAAARHFRTPQDRFDERVDSVLVAAADATSGRGDPQQAVDVTPLYARDNPAFREEVFHASLERLRAAWCYLHDRLEPETLRPVDLLDPQCFDAFRRFRSLGSRLKGALANRHDERDKRLSARIETTDQQSFDRGTDEMFELLDAWRSLRGDYSWAVFEEEKHDRAFVKGCEYLLARLTQLKKILQDIASPVCELSLQGLRFDCVRLESMLRRLQNGAET